MEATMTDETRVQPGAPGLSGRRVVAKVAVLPSLDGERAAVDAAFAAAASDLGGIDLVVHAGATVQATTPAALADVSLAQWHQATQRSLLGTLFCLQAAHHHLQ